MTSRTQKAGPGLEREVRLMRQDSARATMVVVPAPPIYEPMLAVGGPIHGYEDDYAFEPKWDGWRALVTVHGGAVEVRTRTGRLVTDAVPELVAMAEQVGEPSAVLDGELVAHQGTPASFCRVGVRMATRRPSHHSVVPLTFVAFDVLWLAVTSPAATTERDVGCSGR